MGPSRMSTRVGVNWTSSSMWQNKNPSLADKRKKSKVGNGKAMIQSNSQPWREIYYILFCRIVSFPHIYSSVPICLCVMVLRRAHAHTEKSTRRVDGDTFRHGVCVWPFATTQYVERVDAIRICFGYILLKFSSQREINEHIEWFCLRSVVLRMQALNK